MKGKDRARMKKEGQALDITLEVGKSGLSPTIVKELKRQLEKRPLVKAQIRKSAAAGESLDEMAQQLADEAGALLIETRGKTVIYARKHNVRA